jgi:hypothetical protein
MLISQVVVKPQECFLGIAVPMSRGSRRRNLRLSPRADFSARVNWPLYINDTLNPYKPLLRTIRRLKVGLKEDFTLMDFRACARDQRYKVIIIVAHWAGHAVEFFDNLYSMDAILEAIPEKTAVFFDLNICTCRALAERLGIERVFSLVKHNKYDAPSYAGAWFLFYNYLFSLLSKCDLPYMEALDYTADKYKNLFE